MILRFALIFGCFLLLGARGAEGAAEVRGVLAPTRFPPTFDENVFAYGFALFSLTVISSVSAALLLQFMFEHRARRAIAAKLGEAAYTQLCPPGSTCALYRFQIGTLMWMALLGSLPDVLVLLGWGEAPDRVMWLLFQFDRIGDGLAGLPFALFATSYLLSGNIIAHRLALDAEEVPLRPRWVLFKEKARIVAWALVIALGVTAYKAGVV